MKSVVLILAFVLLLGGREVRAQEATGALEWSATTNVNRPWMRWWWQGSAVDEHNLTAALDAYREAGLGGVEITPIYGVAGYEDQFIDYLSPTWMERLVHTLREAERLGLGVDMATGTGWPFGGPMVGAEDAARYVASETYELSGGERLEQPVRMEQEPLLRVIGNRIQLPSGTKGHPLQQAGRDEIEIGELTEPIAGNDHLQALAIDQVRFPKAMPLQVLAAYSDDGHVRLLTDRVGEDGRLDWTAPEGEWTLYAVFQGWHGKMVERAAPGGEGYALDHFSEEAVGDYLAHFSEAFAGLRRGGDGESEVYLQLDPGESIIVRTHETAVQGLSYPYYVPTGAPRDLTGVWHIEFTEGGPVRPGDMEVRRLVSWPEMSVDAFSGPATYRLEFAAPNGDARHWRLDLGVIH